VYGKSDFYPFHMPGHKRNSDIDIFQYDITEITSFDNLHHAEEIIKEEQGYAAKIYGAVASYFLVNGSTCGVLASISACVKFGGKILLCRNAHKSAYNAAYLRHLDCVYFEPERTELGFFHGVRVGEIAEQLENDTEIEAVFLTSPTYEGMISEISEIADLVHRRKIPLIVDAAHGAHLGFHECFPENAIAEGADLVIQSMHKTLPSLTQTAILLVGKEADKYVDISLLQRFLAMYQTSSPSYVFMGTMARCMHELGDCPIKTRATFTEYADKLSVFYKNAKERKGIHLYNGDESNLSKVSAGMDDKRKRDPSKLIIYTDFEEIDGEKLFQIFRDQYHLEFEMAAKDYVLGMTSFMDTSEGFDRLSKAMDEIDNGGYRRNYTRKAVKKLDLPQKIYKMSDIMEGGVRLKTVALSQSIGHVCGEFIYCYPPGMPIIVPGECMTEEIYGYIIQCQAKGLNLQGPIDYTMETIQILLLSY